MIFLVIFAGMALKLENVGPIFSILNPCPSLIAISYNRQQETVSMRKCSVKQQI